METQKDLFGKVVKEKVRKPTRLEKSLLDYDKASFDDRLKRLNYIKKIYPDGLLLLGDMEFVFTFGEIKECYINGHFIAVIVLTQSFIEKIFTKFFLERGFEKETNYGIDKMIKFARKNALIHSTILDKVDELRLKRNPFVHSKDFEYPHSLSKRSFKNMTIPEKQLEKDAKEGIEILFFILSNKL